MGFESKVQLFGFFRPSKRAFQRLKKDAENQQKTGLRRSNSAPVRLPEAFHAQSLDLWCLLKVGCRPH
jgi:hypothetical protein